MGRVLVGRRTLAHATPGCALGTRLPPSREGTDWEKNLRILAIYRLLSPGSEWRLHRPWFGTTTLPDLLGVDEWAAQDDTLYRGLDLLLPHKEERFGHLRAGATCSTVRSAAWQAAFPDGPVHHGSAPPGGAPHPTTPNA